MASAQLPLVKIIKGAPGFGDHAIGHTYVVCKITRKGNVCLEVGEKLDQASIGKVWEWVGNPPNLLPDGSWIVLDHISLVGSEVRFLDMWGGFEIGATATIIKAVPAEDQQSDMFHLEDGRILPFHTLGKVFEFVSGLGSGERKLFQQQTATGFSQAADPQTTALQQHYSELNTANNNGTTQPSEAGK